MYDNMKKMKCYKEWCARCVEKWHFGNRANAETRTSEDTTISLLLRVILNMSWDLNKLIILLRQLIGTFPLFTVKLLPASTRLLLMRIADALFCLELEQFSVLVRTVFIHHPFCDLYSAPLLRSTLIITILIISCSVCFLYLFHDGFLIASHWGIRSSVESSKWCVQLRRRTRKRVRSLDWSWVS